MTGILRIIISKVLLAFLNSKLYLIEKLLTKKPNPMSRNPNTHEKHTEKKSVEKTTYNDTENALIRTNEALKQLRNALGLPKDHFTSEIIQANEKIIDKL